MIEGEGINNYEGGPKWGRVTSHIFVKEPEGFSEKILKYVKGAYLRISVPSQKI